jgi:diguanylate cyclase (GGDEF)-like protein
LPQTPLRQRLLPGLSRRLLAAAALALLAGLGLAALQPGALATSAGPLIVSLCLMLALSWFGLHRLLQQRLLHGVDALSGLLRRPSGSESDDDQWIETGVREFDDLAARLLALSAESRTNQRGLDYVASHDALTGIGNRRYLGERMALALNHLRSHPHVPFSLMLIGLDSFKLVNDGLGHAAGDAALCEVAKRLRALLRPEDSLARLGGDEFALLLYQLRARDAGSFFDKLRAALALPIRLDQRSVNLGVSAGIAEGVVGMTTHDWQRQADLALVAAKREGRNRLSVFRESMQSEAARQLRLEQALRLAIANQDLEVWFQPVVDGSNGNVLGLEALCRWTHEGEAIAPLEFIGLAERSGQISGLGRNVLAGTCSSLRSLRKRHPALRCSVNLSVGQFIDGNIEADVVAAVSAAELPISAPPRAWWPPMNRASCRPCAAWLSWAPSSALMISAPASRPSTACASCRSGL